MRLSKILIKNFKGFRELILDLGGKSAVIFGINGTGKSTVLSAINYCFWIWLNRLNPAQGTAYRSFDAKLVSQGSSNLEISCSVKTGKSTHELVRNYTKGHIGKKATSSYQRGGYDEFVDTFRSLYLTEDCNMPVFVNYGTNRAVLDIPLRIRQKHQFSKLTALERAIENELDFRIFF